MEVKEIKIALLGLGNVGTGVYKVIEKQKDLLIKKIGSKVEIKKILVRDKSKKRLDLVKNELLTENWQEIIEDDEIQIIVEVMGGIEPAKSYILEALKAGKNVVTANKDLLAEYGKDLLDMASLHNKDLAFEASVAGGIPIVRPLKQCLAANDIYEVMGIINGTTNYILTKMTYENIDFHSALEEAKRLGYAEADPTSDIEGYDAARKIAILASLAFHSRVSFKDVFVEGITKITSTDINYARELGYVIKLVAIARNVNNNIETRVHPMFLIKEHPLATVNDSFNAVFVRGDAVGEAMFFGRGAGELPTASAVVGDIIDVGRNIIHNSTGRISCTCYENLNLQAINEVQTSYYLRMQVKDKPGVLASIASVFGNHDVSLASVIQKHRTKGKAEIVMVTDIVKEKYLKDALQIIDGLSIVEEISAVIRVGEDY